MKTKVVELGLATTDEVLGRIKDRLARVWSALQQVDDQNELTAIWQEIQTLATAFGSANSLLAAMVAQFEDMKWQRDVALLTNNQSRREGLLLGRKDLARMLEEQTGEPAAAIDRALGILAGDSDVWVSDYTKEDFFAALKQLVREAEEEALFVEAQESGDTD